MRVLDLGEVLVESNGSLIKPGGRRASSLLCLLALHLTQRVPVDTLIEAVWRDQADERSEAALDTLVWRLRRVLEPNRGPRQPSQVLVNSVGGYRLLLTDDQVDSHRFEMLADDGRELLSEGQPDRAIRRCEDALRLWRGQPFGTHADEPWAVTSRTRLEEIHTEVRERRVDALLALGDSVRAAADVSALTKEMPFREGVWSRLMLACYRAGRVKESLQHYQRVRRLLQDELGTEPSRDLQDLHERILASDPSLDLNTVSPLMSSAPTERVPLSAAKAAGAASTTPTSAHASPVSRAPRWVTPLVGRDAESQQLTQLVRANLLTTMVGTAGCGKTRLAVAVAESLSVDYPDGVWFVDLSTIENPDLVVDVTISAIGIDAAQGGSPVEQLRAFVRNRRMLLLIDNCEQVLAGVREMVSVLLDPGAEFAVIATSREPLDLDGELTWTLLPLPCSDPIELADPDDDSVLEQATAHPLSPAAELFVARLLHASPDLVLDGPAVRTVERICAAADGVPLALELGAARARTYTLLEIAEQMTADPASMARPGGDRSARRHTVGAAIDGSYRLLSEEEKVAHRRLAVLPGLFTADIADAVINFGPGHAALPPTTDLLADLVHRSMLTTQPPSRPGGSTQFRQLATVRAHARRVLETAGEVDLAQESRDHWVLDLMRHRPQLTRADTHRWYDQVDRVFDVVRASLQHHLINQPGRAGPQIMAGLTNFWNLSGRLREGTRWLQLALPLADAETAHGALSAIMLAGSEALVGQTEVADRLIAELDFSATFWAAEEAEDVAAMMTGVALNAMVFHQVSSAMILARHVTTLSNQHPDHVTLAQMGEIAACLTGVLSQADVDTGRLDRAYQRSAATGNLFGALSAAGLLSWLMFARQDVSACLLWLDRNIDGLQVVGGGRVSGQALEFRANLLCQRGEFASAVVQHASARNEMRRRGLRWPTFADTADALTQARAVLGQHVFDLAWHQGTQLGTASARHFSVETAIPSQASSPAIDPGTQPRNGSR